jgi:NAD(P)-dependent dehydrogenase (short-subunit alcohol dehydrogenase family)
MTRKIVVITGASDGIGAAAARQLSAKGYRLLLVGRSREKSENVARQTGAEHFVADFARLNEVRALAGEISSAIGDQGINVLANNAGGIFGDRTPTVDGYERTFQVNHLAPFLLTHLLMPQLRLGQAAIINTSSVANRLYGHIDITDLNNTHNFSATKAYGDSKLENILFTKESHKRYHADGVTSVAFHPGNVRTNFAADSTSLMRFVYHTPLKNLALISADRGGANLVWFIEGTPDATWQSGDYYDERTLTDRVNPQANDPNLAEALWQRSAEMVGLAAHA